MWYQTNKFQIALFFIILLVVLVYGEGYAQKPRELLVESFDKKTPSGMKYDSYHGENAKVWPDGELGVYYDGGAKVKLSRVLISKPDEERRDSALRIIWELLPLYRWGNWLSMRKNLASILDLRQYEGIKFDVLVEGPSVNDVILRFTIADIAKKNHLGKKGEDELFWFDCPIRVLNTKSNWFTVVAPFERFKLSFGDGTRQNNYKLESDKIVAWELNIVSEGRKRCAGSILINNIRAYKD